MEIEELYAMKGRISTEIEIGQQRLQWVNGEISKMINAVNKPKPKIEKPKKEKEK